MIINRRRPKTIIIVRVSIGGDNPIAIQSMTKTPTKEVGATLKQIKELESAGCEIIRLSIADGEDASAIRKIKSATRLPLVADIHFDFRLALAAIDNGIDKIRLNPGNIYKKEEIREVARAAKMAHIPIRVGVNSGSLRELKTQNSILRLSSGLMVSPSTTLRMVRRRMVSLSNREVEPSKLKNMSGAMVKSALDYIKILEGFKFYDIVISLKASNIFDTIDAYRKMAKACDYPFHLGMTATGEPSYGIIKSAISLGALLSEGIGDTLRISLTESPGEEVKAAKAILQVLGLRHFQPEIISCPTCGRCEVDLIGIVKDLEKKLNHQLPAKPIKVAVMGCIVNGPGESKEADIGIAFGKKQGLLFRKGRPIRKISADTCITELLKEMERKDD